MKVRTILSKGVSEWNWAKVAKKDKVKRIGLMIRNIYKRRL